MALASRTTVVACVGSLMVCFGLACGGDDSGSDGTGGGGVDGGTSDDSDAGDGGAGPDADAAGDAGPGLPLPPYRFDAPVNAVLHAGGALFVGGDFTRLSPHGAPRFITVETSGETSSCVSGAGFDGRVFASLQVGNAIYIGGDFDAYRDQPVGHLVKIDATTCALDLTFVPATNPGFDGSVHALAVLGTSLYVGGDFTTYRDLGADSARRIAKLDLTTGALDETFSPIGDSNNGFDGRVNALAVSGTSLYVGGAFGSYRDAGIAANAVRNIAKLDVSTGALDTTFSVGSSGFDAEVRALTVSASGVYAAGDFTTYRGSLPANRIAKVDPASGELDTTFSPPSANGFDGPVFALASSGAALYAGGDFTRYRGTTQTPRIAKLDLVTGAADTTFSPQASPKAFDGSVRALAMAGTSLFVGGTFTTYGAATGVNRIAKLNAATGVIEAFRPGGETVSGVDGDVTSLTVVGSTLLVGGDFSMYAGYRAEGLAKLDDRTFAVDTAFSPADQPGFSYGSVFALAASATSLYVGGMFDTYRDSPAVNIAKLDLVTGALDTAYQPAVDGGFDSRVSSLAIAGGALYATGYFSSYRGVADSAMALAKLDLVTGVLDKTFSPPANNGFSGIGCSLAIAGTSLYVGGSFDDYRGASANNIAKLDLVTGALDTTFSPPTNNGFDDRVCMLAASMTSLYVTGNFTEYRGDSANRVAKLDLVTGALDTTFSPPANNGFDGSGDAIAVAGGAVFVSGTFNEYRGVAFSAKNFAKLDAVTGTLDTTFGPIGENVNGVDGAVFAIAPWGSSVIVGGVFERYRGGVFGNALLKLNAASGALE